jgi:hypothetical protein
LVVHKINFHFLKGNIEHPTSNVQHPMIHSVAGRPLDVRCWMLGIGCFPFTPSTPHPNPSTPVRSRAGGSARAFMFVLV